MSAPYEPPLHPELVLDTGTLSIEEGVSRIIEYLQEKGYLSLDGAPEVEVRSQPRTRAGR